MAHQQTDTFGSVGSSSMIGHSATSTPPQYLPEYLLGEPTSVATSPLHSHRMWSTSNLSDTYRQNQQSPSGSARGNLSSVGLVRSVAPSSVGSERHRQRALAPSGNDKRGSGGGPPTLGLFDQSQLQSRSLFNESDSNSFVASPFLSSPPLQVNLSGKEVSGGALVTNAISAAQLDPFYTQGESLRHNEDPLDATWVTIFGFPPSAVSFILQQFSQYGNIVEHKMSGGNNWIHVHYQSRIQAKKALGKNGKIFCGNVMVGVTPCIDKSAMNAPGKENVSIGSPLSFDLGKEYGSLARPTKPVGIRPLSHSYKAAAGDHEVVPGNCTPQKNGNVVSKAMEYVFGW